jgi:osmotically-inducible protein OsmY
MVFKNSCGSIYFMERLNMRNFLVYKHVRMLLLAAVSVFAVACAGTDTRSSTGEYIDDSVITAKVKTALLNSPAVSGLAIDVEAFRGEVQLSGFVDTKQEREEAGKLAKAVPGVRSVKNDIRVK